MSGVSLRRHAPLLMAALVLLRCGPTDPCATTACDAGVDGGVELVPDAGRTDAGVDAGSPRDAGADAGLDAGTDAGLDGGVVDAGNDAGLPDAGRDGGVDAGLSDAGRDAGVDAGGLDAGRDAGLVDAGRTALGDACQNDAECIAKLGAQAICKTHPSHDPLGTYPGGFCTLRCSSSSSCGDAGVCSVDDGGQLIDLFAIFGEQESYCMPRCEVFGPPTCRAQYACLGQFPEAMTSATFCWWDFADPDPNELRFARGQHASKVGLACTDDATCASLDGGPARLESCIQEALPDAGARESFPGGSCTADSTLDYTGAFCEPDAVSLMVVGSGYQCFKKCDRAMAGRGSGLPSRTCRAGYACDAFSRFADGGLTDGYCRPSCLRDDQCPSASDGGFTRCNTVSGYCQRECQSPTDCPMFNGANTPAACTNGRCQY